MTLKFNAIQIAELVKMIDDETISSKIAKQVFEEMVKSGENPTQIVEAKGLVQISDLTIICLSLMKSLQKTQTMLRSLKQVTQNFLVSL